MPMVDRGDVNTIKIWAKNVVHHATIFVQQYKLDEKNVQAIAKILNRSGYKGLVGRLEG